MKWLTRVLGVLLLLVAVALVVLLVLMGMELQAGLGALLGRGWILLVMCVVSGVLGVYLLLGAGMRQSPKKKDG